MTHFLLHKPWYAGTKHNTAADTDADADSSFAGADPWDNNGFWIPQSTPDKVPPERFELTEPSSDWETIAMDSSQLPYADREDKVDFTAVAHERDIDATLAKLEGKYPKSQVGSSEEQDRTRQRVEQQGRAILAKDYREAGIYPSDYLDLESLFPSNSHRAVDAVHAEVQELNLDVGAEGSDDESIISSTSRRAEHAEAVHAAMEKFKSAGHFGAEARDEAKRDRWQRFRSITKFFGR